MKSRWVSLIVLVFCCLLLAGCHENSPVIESISIDFPHGESRLAVWKNGEAGLFYGSRPQHEIVRAGGFNVHDLYKQLKPRLNPNVPREDWPDPGATAGMVQIKFKDREKSVFLIFNEKAFAEELFKKARQNIIGKRL